MMIYGAPHCRLEVTMFAFSNAQRNYSIMGVPDDFVGQCYRTH